MINHIRPGVSAPTWIKERLEWAGIRSISAIVDILNYVMVELGQPLHAFDLKTLNNEIQVRQAKALETLTLLDGQKVTLDAETLIIADQKAPLAIAGVMGGLDSSVTDHTTHLWIESAYFNPIAIRLAAKRYGLRTDSSLRFERGIDFNLQEHALNRATELLVEIVGGEVGPIIEQKNEALLPKTPEILLRKSRILTVLGTCPDNKQILDILQRAGMSVVSQTEDQFKVTIPSYRQDIALEVDLIEEIARIYGFEKLMPATWVAPLEFFKQPEETLSLPQLKKTLSERGYCEAITYSFMDAKLFEIFQFPEKPLLLANPISAEMAVMRPSLWPGLLQMVQYNQRRQQMRVRVYELGSCFSGDKKERTVLSGIASGPLYSEQWGLKARPHDFYDVKGDIEALFVGMAEKEGIQFESVEHPALHPGKTAKILCRGKTVGMIGALHPRITKVMDVSEPVFVFELDLSSLHIVVPSFRDLSKFPAIRRDIAIVVAQPIFAEEIKSAIVKCVGQWLREVLLFDVYQGPGIEPGKKSIAIGLILQHPSRTLVEEEVADKLKEVVLMLAKQFHAVLRE